MNIKSIAWLLLGNACVLLGAVPLIHLLGDLWQLVNIVFVELWVSGEWLPTLRRLDYAGMTGAAVVGTAFMLAAIKCWRYMYAASLKGPRLQPAKYFFRFMDWGSSRVAIAEMANGYYITGVAVVALFALILGGVCGDDIVWNVGIGCTIWFVSCLTVRQLAKLYAPKNSTQQSEGK